MSCDKNNPTILDLQLEQARQGTILEGVQKDIMEIKTCLMGRDSREGLVMDLDRVKRSMKLIHAVVWTLFTGLAGTIVTVVKKMFLE